MRDFEPEATADRERLRQFASSSTVARTQDRSGGGYPYIHSGAPAENIFAHSE